jgi:hypothetical protein
LTFWYSNAGYGVLEAAEEASDEQVREVQDYPHP